MTAISWIQRAEPVVGQGHPTLADVDNRLVNTVMQASGFPSYVASFSGFVALSPGFTQTGNIGITGTAAFGGLVTAGGGLTVAPGTTLTLTGATVTGFTVGAPLIVGTDPGGSEPFRVQGGARFRLTGGTNNPALLIALNEATGSVSLESTGAAGTFDFVFRTAGVNRMSIINSSLALAPTSAGGLTLGTTNLYWRYLALGDSAATNGNPFIYYTWNNASGANRSGYIEAVGDVLRFYSATLGGVIQTWNYATGVGTKFGEMDFYNLSGANRRAVVMLADNEEIIRLTHDIGFISFFNTANSARSGFVQMTTAAGYVYTSQATQLNFGTNDTTRWSLGANNFDLICSGAFGTIDGSIAGTNLTLADVWSGAVLAYSTSASKWRPHLIQLPLVASGVVKAGLLSDGTAISFADTLPTLSGTPSTPTGTIVVTPVYNGMVIDMTGITALTASQVYIMQYSVDGGAYSGTIRIGTGTRLVHSLLGQAHTYTYKIGIRGGSDSGFLAGPAAQAPSGRTEVSAFGLVVASQISTVNLAALAADLGTITAGLIENAGLTSGIYFGGPSLSTVPSTWTQGIFFAGANPVPGTVTGMYIDFTATSTNHLLHHTHLDLNADGSALFSGAVDIQDAYLSSGYYRAANLSLHTSGLAHGMTQTAPTDVNMFLSRSRITALSTNDEGLKLEGAVTTAPTSISGPVTVRGFKKSGTGVTDLVAGENIFSVLKTSSTTGGDITTAVEAAVFRIRPDAIVCDQPLSVTVSGSNPKTILWLAGQINNQSRSSNVDGSVGIVTVKANSLGTNGDVVIISVTGQIPNATGTFTITVKLNTTVIATATITTPGVVATYTIKIHIARTGASAWTSVGEAIIATDATNITNPTCRLTRATGTESWASDVPLDFRIQSNNTNAVLLDSATAVVESQ